MSNEIMQVGQDNSVSELDKGKTRFTVVTSFRRFYEYTAEIDAHTQEEAEEIALSIDADDPRVTCSDWDDELKVDSCTSYSCQLCGEDLGDIWEAKVILPFGDCCGECVAEINQGVRASTVLTECESCNTMTVCAPSPDGFWKSICVACFAKERARD
jgi:hypothetical protein